MAVAKTQKPRRDGASEVTGLGFEPRTYGLKVQPGHSTTRDSYQNSGQLVRSLRVLEWAQGTLVPLFVPLPWKQQTAVGFVHRS